MFNDRHLLSILFHSHTVEVQASDKLKKIQIRILTDRRNNTISEIKIRTKMKNMERSELTKKVNRKLAIE